MRPNIRFFMPLLFASLLVCQNLSAQIRIEQAEGVVVQIKTDFELDSSFKVTAKSTTCRPVAIATGVFVVSEPGKHLLDVDVLSFEKQVWESQLVEVNVGNKPKPVDPDVTPVEPDEPDEPDVTPNPVDPVTPAKLTNPKVLFVVESATQAQLPSSQASVLFSKKVRDHLKDNGVEWMRVDPDSEFVTDSSPFKPMLSRDRSSMPWMVIFGDEGIGTEEPLSPNVEAFLRTVDQYIVKPSKSQPPVERPKLPVVPPLQATLVPAYETRVVPRQVLRRIPRQVCRMVGGRQVCETIYETVTETVYETQYLKVAQ